MIKLLHRFGNIFDFYFLKIKAKVYFSLLKGIFTDAQSNGNGEDSGESEGSGGGSRTR